MEHVRFSFSRIPLLFLASIAMMALIVSCGEPEPMEIPDNWREGNDPCEDGIQNFGEDGIDCGGDCAPCGGLILPCSVPVNRIVYQGVTFTVTSMIVLFDEVLIQTTGPDFTIRTGNDIAPGITYALTAAVNPSGLNAHVLLDDGFDDFRSQNGSGALYVEGTSSSMILTICDANLRLVGGSTIRSFKFKGVE